MGMICLEMSQDDAKLLEVFKGNEDLILISIIKRFDGVSDYIQALVTLTTISIPLVAKIIIEKIRSKKHISIKYGGIEIKGISEDNVFQVLENLKGAEKKAIKRKK